MSWLAPICMQQVCEASLLLITILCLSHTSPPGTLVLVFLRWNGHAGLRYSNTSLQGESGQPAAFRPPFPHRRLLILISHQSLQPLSCTPENDDRDFFFALTFPLSFWFVFDFLLTFLHFQSLGTTAGLIEKIPLTFGHFFFLISKGGCIHQDIRVFFL